MEHLQKHQQSISYWQDRARLSYSYNKETFYTITPIPYYFQRRKILLNLLENTVFDKSISKVCDFGCGDGWYIDFFSKKFSSIDWFGVDISENMIKRAKENCVDAKLYVSNDGIKIDEKFDLIYSIAVFAHVLDDNQVKSLFKNISEKLVKNGSFVIFEQTGPESIYGEVWCRRTVQDYVSMAMDSGLVLDKHFLISFPVYRFFEKFFLSYYYRLFSKGKTSTERSINANKSVFFRILISALIKLSGTSVYLDDVAKKGNSLLIF